MGLIVSKDSNAFALMAAGAVRLNLYPQINVIEVLIQGYCQILLAIVSKAVYNLYIHPLSNYPGPFLARASRLYYAYYLRQGTLSMQMMKLHSKYGDCLRIAPDEISYTNAEAWQDIYGTVPSIYHVGIEPRV